MIKSEDDRKYLCEVCGMAFRRNDIRRRHEITHSKEYRYFCAICGKGFIRRYVLVKHLARDHNSTDVRKIIYQKNKKKFDEELGDESKENRQDGSMEDIPENGKQEMLSEEQEEEEAGEDGSHDPQLVDATTQQDNSHNEDDIEMQVEQHAQQQEEQQQQMINNDVLYLERGDGDSDENIHATALLAVQVPVKIVDEQTEQDDEELETVEGEEHQIIKVEMIT